MPTQTQSEVPEEVKQDIHTYANTPEVFSRLLKSFDTRDITPQSRLAGLLQLFRGSDQLHVLIGTQPGDRVNALCDWLVDSASPTVTVSGARVDSESLIGRYTTTGEQAKGILRETNTGIAHIRRLGLVPSLYATLAEPMGEGQITVATGGYHDSFKANTSILATTRFEDRFFDPFEAKMDQLMIDQQLQFAFDSITVGQIPDDQKQTEQINLPPEYTSVDINVDPIPDNLVQAHIQLSEGLNPELSDRATEFLRDVIETTQEFYEDDDSITIMTDGLRDSLTRLARASARIRLSTVVEKTDIRIATLVSPAGLTVNQNSGNSEVSIIETEMSKPERDKVKRLKDTIDEIIATHEHGAPIDTIVDRVGNSDDFYMSESEITHHINKLKQKGELYEPYENMLRTT